MLLCGLVSHFTMYYPSLDEFNTLANDGNLIPVTRQILADFDTPVSAYWKLRDQGETFLFESVEGGEHLGRYSFVGCNPKAIISQNGDTVEIRAKQQETETFHINRDPKTRGDDEVCDALEVIETYLKRFNPVTLPKLPRRFTGGAVGFIGYEYIHDIESVVPRPEKDELGTPTVYFLIADELLIFDRVSQTITLVVNAKLSEGCGP